MKVTKLKYVASGFRSGGTPDTASAEYWAHGDEPGIPWVAIADMSNREYISRTTKQITQAGRRSKGLDILPPGVLLYSMYASLGHVAELNIEATINQAILGIMLPPSVDQRFVTWALRYLQPQVIADASSNTQDNLNAEKVKNLRFPLPPLPRQRAIAAYLDRETAKIDAMIAAKERLLTLLAEKRRALITHAVTRGLNPDAPMKDSGVEWLGEIPKHWPVWKLGHLARIGNGSTPKRDNLDYWTNGTVPWINSSVVNQDEVTSASRYVTSLAVRECHLPIVPAGSVLIAITGQGKTRGMASVLSINSTINQHMAFVTPLTLLLEVWYLRWTLFSAYPMLRSISDDSGGTKGALTCEDVAAFRMPLPPLQEQREIVAKINAQSEVIARLSERLSESIVLLTERRSALVAAAVTGQIDVEDAA